MENWIWRRVHKLSRVMVIHSPGKFKNLHNRAKQKLQSSLFMARIIPIQHSNKGSLCWLDILIRIYRRHNEFKKKFKFILFISQNSFKAWDPGWGETIKLVLSDEEFLRFETILLLYFSFTGGPAQSSKFNHLPVCKELSERENICKNLAAYRHRCLRFYFFKSDKWWGFFVCLSLRIIVKS